MRDDSDPFKALASLSAVSVSLENSMALARIDFGLVRSFSAHFDCVDRTLNDPVKPRHEMYRSHTVMPTGTIR